MADRTGAERQARYRAHRRGDHALCDPQRCDPTGVTVTPTVTRDAVTAPPGLGTRGRRLWRDVVADGVPLSPAERVLLEEACRIADRLDRLDAVLRGDVDSWMRLLVDDEAREAVLVIDKALAEARQQQVALKQLVAELRQSRTASGAVPAPRRGQGGQARTSGTGARSPAAVKGAGGVIADLTSRLAGRRDPAAG